jgi:HEAT repeat protein
MTLGEIGCSSALPFLLEALYDHDEIVRIQAVTSLGSLRLPSAIGALLDMARHHPEMPAELVSRALSACSVECFDIGLNVPIEGELLSLGDGALFSGEITELEPAALVDELPESSTHPLFKEYLERVARDDDADRAEAARALGDFRVQASVEALTKIVFGQVESPVRAAAVTALGSIDHESVFVPIIVALGDGAREVRAAAARALSGLNIDRADAYVRVVESENEKCKRDVASACVKSGIANQAVGRLGSADRRLAYEAFATLSVLVSAGLSGPVVEAIGNTDENIAVAATRILGNFGSADVLPALRQMAVRDSISENVRTSVLEVIYKIDQGQPV